MCTFLNILNPVSRVRPHWSSVVRRRVLRISRVQMQWLTAMLLSSCGTTATAGTTAVVGGAGTMREQDRTQVVLCCRV